MSAARKPTGLGPCTGKHARRYKREWMRRRRRVRAYRARERELDRARQRDAWAKYRRDWKREHRRDPAYRAAERARHKLRNERPSKPSRPLCHFCKFRPPKTVIERLVADGHGNFQRARVPYCGVC